MKGKTALILSIAIFIGSMPICHAEQVDDIEFLRGLGVSEITTKDADKMQTRGGFIKLLNYFLELPESEENAFADVSEDLRGTVSKFAATGIVSGYDGQFMPDKTITVQEAASILVRSCENQLGIKMFKTGKEENNAAEWAKLAVDKAITAGFIKEDADFSCNLTVAKSAELVKNYLMYVTEDRVFDDEAEINFIQFNRGNIYVGDEIPKITVDCGYTVFEYTVVDFWKNVVKHECVKTGGKPITLEFGDLSWGNYWLIIYGTNKNGDRTEIGKTTFCRLPKYEYAPHDKSPFGVNAHPSYAHHGWTVDLVNEIEKVGIRHMRSDIYQWMQAEKEKGVYVAHGMEEYQENVKRGIQQWTCPGFENPFYDNCWTPYTEEGTQAFANYASEYYNLYGFSEYNRNLEIYNEYYGKWGDIGDGPADRKVEYYKPLLEKTYKTTKAKNPDSIIQAMVPTTGMLHDYYVNDFISMGLLDYIDELTMHIYIPYVLVDENQHIYVKNPNNEDVSQEEWISTEIGNVKKMVFEKSGKKLGEDMRFAVTETGTYVSPDVSEELQSIYDIRIHLAEQNEGAYVILIYDFFNDGNAITDPESNFGFIRGVGNEYGSYTPKPLYVAYGVLAGNLKDKKILGQDLEDGVYRYYTESEEGGLNIIFADREDKDVTIYTQTPVRTVDFMGNEETYYPVDGKVFMTASQEVKYIYGDKFEFDVTSPFEVSVKTPYVNMPVGINVAVKEGLSDDGITYATDIDEGTGTVYASESVDKVLRSIPVIIKKDGKVAGVLLRDVQMKAEYDLETEISIEKDNGKFINVLNAKVINNSEIPLNITGFDYILDGVRYHSDASVQVPVGGEKDVDILLEGDMPFYIWHTCSIRVCVNGESSSFVDAEVNEFLAPIERRTMIIDGELDNGIEELSMIDFGKYNVASFSDSLFEGENDLSGKGWVSYDDDNLYFAAEITDDIHYAPEREKPTYKYDCFQIGIRDNLNPEYQGKSNEFSLFVDNDGSAGIWRYSSIEEIKDNSNIDGVVYAVRRNDASKKTIYEVSVPWQAVHIDGKTAKTVNLEFAINDSDGVERDNARYLNGNAIIFTKNYQEYGQYTFMR